MGRGMVMKMGRGRLKRMGKRREEGWKGWSVKGLWGGGLVMMGRMIMRSGIKKGGEMRWWRVGGWEFLVRCVGRYGGRRGGVVMGKKVVNWSLSGVMKNKGWRMRGMGWMGLRVGGNWGW